jgi:hypothetical protein
MAVNQRARVLYRLPEQRRFGASGLPGMLTMVLAALVLFLGGLVVGRATMTGREPAATAPQATAAAPTATTAAAAEQAPPGTAAATTAADGPGPTRVEGGVGVGYARSEQGAVAAAANYTRALSSAQVLDNGWRRRAIETLAAPEATARLQRDWTQAVASLRQGLGVTGAAAEDTRVLLRATPVGWRTESYGGGRAKVAIWVTSVGGSLGGARGPVPVREVWGTTTVTLRWVEGDWKQTDSTTTDGPVPIADVAPPTAAAELIGQANEFKEFSYAPGS